MAGVRGLWLWIPAPIAWSAVLALSADMTVAHRARSLQPGEVVMLTMESARPLQEVRVSAFGRSFLCFRTADPLTWAGLVGIDLETKPGRYVVNVTGRDAEGKAVTAEHPMTVAPKAFATRTLTVDPQFVTPPREALARIQKESERVRAIFEAVSPERVLGRAVRPSGPRETHQRIRQAQRLQRTAAQPAFGNRFRRGHGHADQGPERGESRAGGQLVLFRQHGHPGPRARPLFVFRPHVGVLGARGRHGCGRRRRGRRGSHRARHRPAPPLVRAAGRNPGGIRCRWSMS